MRMYNEIDTLQRHMIKEKIGSESMSPSDRYSIPLTPLEERLTAEAPELLPAVTALRQRLGEDAFDQYVSPLVALRKVDGQLLVLTKKEMHRSILVGQYRNDLKEVFGVEGVRVIVSQ